VKKLLLFVAFVTISPAQATASQYTIVDLGVVGRVVDATDINNRGQIVGYAFPGNDQADPAQHANVYLWLNGTRIDLGTLGTPQVGAFGINENGSVVGQIDPPNSNPHSFLFDPNIGFANLPHFGLASGAAAINDVNQIVGGAYYETGYRAFLYDRGQMSDLGTLGGHYSSATDVNNRGQIVGSSTVRESHPFRAFLYDNGTMLDLGTLGGASSVAYAVNESTQIVGYATTIDGGHAFLYQPIGGMRDIGTLGETSSAYDINESGHVVGIYFGAGEATSRAFVYDSVNGMRDLHSLIPHNSGWTQLFDANAINDHGQIVGSGRINGEKHAFLLTPIPEPSTLLTLLVGTACLASLAAARRLFRGP
jgi:probable HAF family extracellular repeat protein